MRPWKYLACLFSLTFAGAHATAEPRTGLFTSRSSELSHGASVGTSGVHAASFEFLGCDPDEDRAGYAASGYVIPAALLNDDFTLRFVYQTGEYQHTVAGTGGNYPFLRIADADWEARINVGHQMSPYTFFQVSTGRITRPASSPNDSVVFKGSAAIEGWEDNFLVYHRNDASLYANAYWELDEYSGPRADGGQRGHDMVPVGTVPHTAGHTPANPGAVSFSGQTRGVYLAAQDSLSSADLDFHGSAWTVAFRIRKTSATLGSVLSKRGAGGNSIDIKADTALRFHYSPDGTKWRVIDGPPLAAGAWRHVVLRCEAGILSMRIDGGDWSTTVMDGKPAASTASVALGRQVDAGNALDAALDNVGIWQRALSDEECAALFNKSRDGYLRLYRGSSQMARGAGSPYVPWDHEIPVGVDNDWRGRSYLRVMLGANRMYGAEYMTNPGEPVYKNTDQRFRVFEVALWTRALDTDRMMAGTWAPWPSMFIQVPHYISPVLESIAGRPLPSVPDGTAHLDALHLYYAATDEGVENGLIHEGTGTGADLQLYGRSRWSRRAPNWTDASGAPLPAAPADAPTGCSVSASAVDATHIRIDSISPGSSPYGDVDRIVYVHRGNDPKHAFTYRNRLQDEASIEGIEVPPEWREYRVTVDWTDPYGNLTRRTVSVALPDAVYPPNTPDTRVSALRITGLSDISQNGYYPLPVNMPMTLRLYLKMESPAPNVNKVWSLEDGLTPGFGYVIARLAVDGAQLHVMIGDGDKVSEDPSASGSLRFVSGSVTPEAWQEWWVQIQRPTGTSAGFIRLYRSNPGEAVTLVDQVDLPVATDWWTDWSFKKWWGHIRLGENTAVSEYASYGLASVSWWTRILDPDTEIPALSWMDLAKLSAEQRFEDDLYWHIQPAPMNGLVTHTFGYGPAAHMLDMPLAGNVAYVEDSPFNAVVPVPRTMADVVQALRWAGGLDELPADAGPGYDVLRTGPSNGVVDLSDALEMARIVTGMAQNTE